MAVDGFSDITEQDIENHLITYPAAMPDLLIRTRGEYRISNFLLWQAAYAELYFSEVLWPDFGAQELHQAVADFSRRQRRYGMIGEQVTSHHHSQN